jgi:hypothetical protein
MELRERVIRGITWRVIVALIFITALLLALDVSGGNIGKLMECGAIFILGMFAVAYQLSREQRRIARMEHDLITSEGLWAFDAPDGVWRGDAFQLEHPSLHDNLN